MPLFSSATVLEPHHAAVAPSPPNGHPKTPRPRVSVKQPSKPTGPVHPDTGRTGLAEALEEKRAALTQAVMEPHTPSFLLDDDGDESASAARQGSTGGDLMDGSG